MFMFLKLCSTNTNNGPARQCTGAGRWSRARAPREPGASVSGSGGARREHSVLSNACSWDEVSERDARGAATGAERRDGRQTATGAAAAALRGGVAQPRAPRERDEQMPVPAHIRRDSSPWTFTVNSLLPCSARGLLCFSPNAEKGFHLG